MCVKTSERVARRGRAARGFTARGRGRSSPVAGAGAGAGGAASSLQRRTPAARGPRARAERESECLSRLSKDTPHGRKSLTAANDSSLSQDSTRRGLPQLFALYP